VADVLPANTGTGSVVFTVAGSGGELTWVLETRSGDRFLVVANTGALRLESSVSSHDRADVESAADPAVNKNLADLVYLSAVREGTADVFPVPDMDTDRFGDVGVDGRFAAYWYNRIVDDPVADSRLHPVETANSVRKQLDAWMSTLFTGAQANVQYMPHVSLLSLQFRLSDIGPWHRPANVGYGLTYVFPILVALLAAREGQMIVIDSPEAHLHPYAQSQMGRVLAHFAAAGVQILVETHSDHLLNGVRLAVRDGIVAPGEVQLHFFSGPADGGNGVISPILDVDGRIDEWPEGFFDQTEKDLSRLAGWD
jgi:predicted ATPase